MNIPFTKMQGIGNDIVIIDNSLENILLTTEQIRQMGDRHFGIGFDQLLLITPPPLNSSNIAFGCIIYNTDGSQAQQCGNGVRCFARFVYKNKLINKPVFNIAIFNTHNKINIINIKIQENNTNTKNNSISINMGLPILEPDLIPFRAKAIAPEYTVDIPPQTIKLGVVSMGNPHAVIHTQDNIDLAPVTTLGPLLMSHPDFPEQANIGFMQILSPNYIKLRVYERGAGETLACGSGACAAVVAGCLQGLLAEDVTVCLPGGELVIQWQGKGFPVWMTGPAEFVFTGIYKL